VPHRHRCGADLPRSSRRSPSSFPAIAASTARRSEGLLPFRRHLVFAVGFALFLTIDCTTAYAQAATARPVIADAISGPFATFVAEASQRFGIPATWIQAVMRAESFGDAHAVSPKGAVGLMQIMPETWASLRERYHLGADPSDAHDNIVAGAAYLRELHDRYGIPGFLAAYHAGPARWEDHVATGRPLPAETRAYLARLAPIVGGGAADDAVLLASVARSWTEASLFPAHPQKPPTDNQPTSTRPPSRTSVDRPVQDWTGLVPQSDGLFVASSGRGRSQ
jgi:soluble lytic murein transglycosylase-like protein